MKKKRTSHPLPPLPPEVEAKLATQFEDLKRKYGFANGEHLKRLDEACRGIPEYEEAKKDPAKWNAYIEKHIMRPAVARFERDYYNPLMSRINELVEQDRLDREAGRKVDRETYVARLRNVLDSEFARWETRKRVK